MARFMLRACVRYLPRNTGKPTIRPTRRATKGEIKGLQSVRKGAEEFWGSAVLAPFLGGSTMARTDKVSKIARTTAKGVVATAKATKARAPKKAAPVTNPDLIVSNINDQTGAHIVVTSAAGATISYPRYGDDKQRRVLSSVGGSLKALQADLKARPPVKPTARLARGVDSHNSPHSAKAVADQPKGKAAGKPAAKSAKAAAPKAEKNKQPSRGAERDYTVAKGAENKARPDSWRHHMTAMILGSANTAKAKAAHAKSGKFPGNKLDFNWAATQGFIKFAK